MPHAAEYKRLRDQERKETRSRYMEHAFEEARERRRKHQMQFQIKFQHRVQTKQMSGQHPSSQTANSSNAECQRDKSSESGENKNEKQI